MELETIATLVTIAVGIVGLGATVLATNGRTRTELKTEIAGVDAKIDGVYADLKADIAGVDTKIDSVRNELKVEIGKLDDRVYALAAGLAPRLVPGDEKA